MTASAPTPAPRSWKRPPPSNTPVAGQILHWGLDAASLAREERYRLRRRIAYLTPEQVLLSRLNLGENIALGTSFQAGTSTRSVLARHADLLERLALQPFLPFLPHEVEAEVYIRALWAREFIKQPDLIVAVLGEAWEPHDPPEQGILFLKDYLTDRRGAALLLGQSLDRFHPLASRLLRWDAGRLLSQPLSEHRGRPLTDFLPLLPRETSYRQEYQQDDRRAVFGTRGEITLTSRQV